MLCFTFLPPCIIVFKSSPNQTPLPGELRDSELADYWALTSCQRQCHRRAASGIAPLHWRALVAMRTPTNLQRQAPGHTTNACRAAFPTARAP